MDGHRFDRLTRAFAAGISRRGVLRVFASGAGAGALATTGLDRFERVALADVGLTLVKTPKIKRTSSGVEILVVLPAPSACAIEYGTTSALGDDVESQDLTIEHTLELPNLDPGTRYYFRVVALTENGPVASRIYKFNAPTCIGSSILCGGTCVPKCGPGAALDPVLCTCVCAPGFANCNGDLATGCETRLGTTDNCLGCGNACDDGNACTDNACDPSTGCVTTNVPDGTPCASDGVCVNGACADCVPGGACAADADCCDDEACCGGVCAPKTAYLDDINNCGGCGVVCPSGPCQVASCVDGVCQSAPAADGEACDDGNSCTVEDHCMAGTCMGKPVENGAACGDGGMCTDGTCVMCAPGQTCAADADCCADEVCCGDVCIAKSGLEDDSRNCGACGKVCEQPENSCEHVICTQGQCVTEDAEPGAACDDNPCVENGVCQDGVCQGSPAKEGTPCGVAGTCQDGACVEPISFTAAAAGTLFSDDFESGSMAKWSTVSGVTVQSSVAAAGSYGARATGSGTVAYARKTLSTAQPEIFVRTRFKVISQGANSVYLLRTFKSSSSPLLSLFLTSSGRLATFNNVTGATLTSATTVTKNTWHELTFRVRVNGTQSLGTVWLNGSKIYDVSKTTNLGATGTKLVQIGDNVARRTFDVAFDDVALCTGGLCPALPPATSSAPGATKSVLVARYDFGAPGSFNWSKTRYQPRQFKRGLAVSDPTLGLLTVEDDGAYGGWDLFPTYNYGTMRRSTKASTVSIYLNRPSTVAVVWRSAAPIPSWLSNWARSSRINVGGVWYETYRRAFGAGQVVLGGVYNPGEVASISREMYWVLLAEVDGLPSPPPAVPSGLELPRPNTICPSWVHDRFTATGPDGASYRSWHPEIDSTYWCYFGHEHGTNPSYMSAAPKPVFGYTANKHGMDEPHVGFKTYIFDDQFGNRWMITHHFGTAGLGRVCTRFHTADIAVQSATKELLLDIHFMADFGRSTTNDSSETVSLTPPACPDQATLAITDGSRGARQLPVESRGKRGYEPWRAYLAKTVFGFSGDFVINTLDPMVICNTVTCDSSVPTGATGTNRLVKFDGLKIFGGARSGVFFTDPFGQKIVSADDPSAVRQFIAPRLALDPGVTENCTDVRAWGRPYICHSPEIGPSSREGSVTTPN